MEAARHRRGSLFRGLIRRSIQGLLSRSTARQGRRRVGKIRLGLSLLLLSVLLPVPSRPADEMNSTILIGNSRIDVGLEKSSEGPYADDLNWWIRSSAESVATYYGHFPLPHLWLRVSTRSGRGIGHGKTFARDGGTIYISVGSETSRQDFELDWMLTHEMVHLAFPSMPDDQHWIEEGTATYVEPIARVQAKHLDAREMWYELARDLPQGLPGPGDQGLDHTHTWGRTYWGGALFCFLSDVRIRQETKNQKGLQDALRAVLDSGADIRRDMDLESALTIGDRAVGVPVLVNLYRQMKDKPSDTELATLWQQLGVKIAGKTVGFNDNAPLAATRIAITTGRPANLVQAGTPAQARALFAGVISRTRAPRLN